MGSNFASIHIFDSSLSVDQRAFSEDYLNKLHDVNLEYQKRIQMYCNNPSIFGICSENNLTESVRESLKRELLLQRNAVCFKRQNGFLSSFDDSFTFETIEKAARDISGLISSPLLYASTYDDDIFLAGVYVCEKCLTQHVAGNLHCLKEYGLQRINADPNVLCNCFDVQNRASIERFCKQRSAQKSQSTLEIALGICLDD